MITDINNVLCLIQKGTSAVNESSDQETVLALNAHPDCQKQSNESNVTLASSLEFSIGNAHQVCDFNFNTFLMILILTFVPHLTEFPARMMERIPQTCSLPQNMGDLDQVTPFSFWMEKHFFCSPTSLSIKTFPQTAISHCNLMNWTLATGNHQTTHAMAVETQTSRTLRTSLSDCNL